MAVNKYDDIKIFKIISYLGLWIVGLFVKQKNDKKLKFHVGQGIILSIYCVISNLVKIIITELANSIFKYEYNILGIKTVVLHLNTMGKIIVTTVSLVQVLSIILFAIIGIRNVLNDKQKELPIIGRFSFYN